MALPIAIRLARASPDVILCRRSTAAGTRDPGGAFDPAQQVKTKKRLGIGFLGVAHCSVPAAASIHLVTPGDRVVSAHCPAGIGRLVQGRQNPHRAARVAAEIIPFVGTFPGSGQTPCRRVVGIFDTDNRPLSLWVAREPGADEATIPRPVVLCVTRRVDADEAAPGADV